MIKDIKLFNIPQTDLFNREMDRAVKFSQEIFMRRFDRFYKCLSSDFHEDKYSHLTFSECQLAFVRKMIQDLSWSLTEFLFSHL